MNNKGPYHKDRNGGMVHLRVFISASSRECKISMEDDSTLEQYFAKKIDLTRIESLTQEIHSILDYSSRINKENREGAFDCLKEAGEQLYHALLPHKIKDNLRKTDSKGLLLILEDSLIGIPWEMMHDGEDFLCVRFNIGRRIFTSHSKRDRPKKPAGSEIKMIILADPTGDLPKSYQEGLELSRALKQLSGSLQVYFITKDITVDSVSRYLLDCDILHYAGHALYNSESPDLSGWRLKDGILTAQRIMELSGGKRNFPSLIFSNACQSGETAKWSMLQPDESSDTNPNQHINPNAKGNTDAFDLVNAFLRCGVRHYIGTLRNISDPSSLGLSLKFYNFILDSYTIGESLRLARVSMIEDKGRDNLIWAHYALYGNPSISYLRKKGEAEGVAQSEIPDCISGITSCGCGAKGIVSGQGINAPVNADLVVQGADNIQGVRIRNVDSGERKRSPGEHITPEGASPHQGKLSTEEETGQGKGMERTHKRLIKHKKLFLAGALLLFFLIILFAGIGFFVYHYMRPHPAGHGRLPFYGTNRQGPAGNGDMVWEERKWEVVERIQDRLRKRFSASERERSNRQEPLLSESVHHGSIVKGAFEDKPLSPATLCIISENPEGREGKEEELLTGRIIKELYRFWINHSEYAVVERDRIDFVMRELELATSSLNENKIYFALGKLFGAKGTLFVRIFTQSKPSFFSIKRLEPHLYLHYVDTETTEIRAIADAPIKGKGQEELRDLSSRLSEEIIYTLKHKEMKRHPP